MRPQRLSKLRGIVLGGVLLLLAAPPLSAQLRITGTISGTVQDPSGAAIAGASVVLRDEGTGITRATTATQAGSFIFPDLAHGSYELTVSAPGFQTAVHNRIAVSTSQTSDVRIKLAIGQQSETLVVESGAPVLEATSQLVAETLKPKAITELPVANRSGVLGLARLAPGASPPVTGNTRYNNLPGGAVNVTVDGINDASNGFKSGGTVFFMTVPVRLGAVEEVSVETGGLGADSGAQSGANIKFVTKRGTNQFRGSLFYEPNHYKLNANSWARNAVGQPRIVNRRHDFGGSVGGPLLKEKLFFFVNFERSYAPQSTARNVTLLTPEAERGIYKYVVAGTTNQVAQVNVLDLAAQRGAPTALDPVTQSIINYNRQIPPNARLIPDTDLNRDTYTWDAENNDYAYFPTVRLDYFVTPKHQLTGSWNYRHNWQAGERRLPIPDMSRTNPFRLGYFVWAASVQSSFSPRTFNELRAGVQHSGDTNTRAEYGQYYEYNGEPLRINGANPAGLPPGQLPFNVSLPFIDQQNTTGRHYITTVYDTLTLTRGEHHFTIGGSYRKTDWNDQGEVFQIPTYNPGTPAGDPLPSLLFNQTTMPGVINTDTGGNSGANQLYNLLTGRVAQANFVRVVDPEHLVYDGFINHTWTRSQMGGLYVQDRWRLRPSLTLNFGLRWEVQAPMHDVNGLTASPDLQSLYGPSTALFTPGALSGNNNPTVEVGRQAYRTDWRNLAPNFGFAWNPTKNDGFLGKLLGGSKTVIRGSYGLVYYDEGTQMFAQNLGPNAGKQITSNLIPGQSSLPAFYTLGNVAGNLLTPASFPFANTNYNRVINQADQTFLRNINGMDPTLRAPYTINWNLGFQRQLGRNLVVEARYVANRGKLAWRTVNLNEVNIFENGFLQEFRNAQRNLAVNLANGVNSFENRGLPGQVPLPIFDAAFGARGGVGAIAPGAGYGSAAYITNLQNGAAGAMANALATNREHVCRMFGSAFSPCLRVNPAYNTPGNYPINFFLLNPYVAGPMLFVDDTGSNAYDGLQIQLRQRYSAGLEWTLNYALSSSQTNLARDVANQNLDWTTLRTQGKEWRPSPFDVRHVVQAFGTYELPIGKGRAVDIKSGFLDGLLGGWTVGSVFVFNSGQPIQLHGGFQTVNTSNNPLSRGVRLAPGVTVEQIQDMFNHELTRVTGRAAVTDQQRLAVDPRLIGPDGRANPQYLLPNTTPGEFGDIIFIRDRHAFLWNASIAKNINLTDRTRLQLFASFNNVLNHPRWGLGDAVAVPPPAFTDVTSTSFGIINAPGAQAGIGFRTINLRATVSF
jgi:hypothetical protein